MSFQYVPLKDNGPPRGDGRANRRASVRYHCGPATAGRVVMTDNQEFQRAWILDLSREGVGLLLSRPVQVGQYLYIQIKSSSTRQPFELAARVAHADKQTGGEWLVGCELLKHLTDDELEALL